MMKTKANPRNPAAELLVDLAENQLFRSIVQFTTFVAISKHNTME